VCGLPATLGRDGDAEIALRDPGVSRRHARLDLDPTGAELVLVDLGSRGGTKLGGVALGAPLVLPASGEIDLGVACHLGILHLAPLLWRMDGLAGLDRGLCVLVGAGPLPLALVDPAAADLAISFSRPTPRLIRGPDVVVRTAGRLVGTSFDLAHGDVFQTESGFTLEIV
jgi:hypothetical protein